MRKIVFLTGTRADFGKMRPLIKLVESSNDFENYVFITGMHTLSRYGSTYHEVLAQGYRNNFIFMNQTSTSEMDSILANTITGFSNFVKEIRPDLIVVHGDRVEALAGAIVGALNNILTAHVEGGELSGTIDELIRHSISKLSHVHFVSNEEAKKRLIQMGELESSIFVIGSPDIDIMMSEDLPGLEKVMRHYEIPFKDYAIMSFHPVTTHLETLGNDVRELVEGVMASGLNYVVIYPNNDPGTEIIQGEYKKLEDDPRFRVFPSVRFEFFLTLMKNAKFIIGNSSAGIREAEVFGVPSVNVGDRQMKRSESANIINVAADRISIEGAISSALKKKVRPVSHFGKGDSAQRFIGILSGLDMWGISIQKSFKDRI